MVFGDKVSVLWGTDLMFSVSDFGKFKISLITVRCKAAAVVLMETQVQRIVTPIDTASFSRRLESSYKK